MRSLILILTLVLNIESTDADSTALPNVVLILSDDQGTPTMAHGSPTN